MSGPIPRSSTPIGRSATFRESVIKVRGEAYADAWLAPAVNCQFSDMAIFTTNLGADELGKSFGEKARSLGIKIIPDSACRKMLHDHAAMLASQGINHAPRRRRSAFSD